MDKLASLRAFVKVVELGSFSEAGRQLRLSRSAISKYVSDLEQSLGVQLLNRTTRHASPNENGQAYFERALGILADIDAADQAVAQLQSTPRGLLRVNAPMSFGTLQLGPAIADFMARYPELQIQLVLSDEQVDPVQGGFDVTLRIAELESSSLIARKIVPIERVVCASPILSRRAHGVPTHPRELRDHVSLTYGFLLTGNQWKLTGADGDHWIQPSWQLVRQQRRSAARCRDEGHGASRCCRPSSPARRCMTGELAAVLDDYHAPPLTPPCDLSADTASRRSRCVCSSIFWSSGSVRGQSRRSVSAMTLQPSHKTSIRRRRAI